MWKIYHKLFGWHYISVRGWKHRVRITPNGELYYQRDYDGMIFLRDIPGLYKPLTWTEEN